MTAKISACIITKNEEKHIRKCLESIKNVVDEIVIVDGYSIDKTIDICKEYTDKIYIQKFSGSFAEERTTSVSKASHDWILQIDADETLSEKLQTYLRDLTQYNKYVAHSFARRNYYDKEGTKWTKHAYFPDYQPRLFKKDKLKYDISRTIMEEAIIDGKIRYAPFDLYLNHYVPYKYSYSNFKNQHLRSVKLQAKWTERTKPKAYYILKMPFVYFHHFFNLSIYNRWYLDGIIGLKAASIMAFYMVMVNYYTAFEDDKIPISFLKLFEKNDPLQKQIDNEYKIKIWEDL
ncbi:glycosyltransferase family 2 protein [Candidatus Pacearchaeota archaeon]|nr:glycosyltransferase family 2 protein [Candidatus Pacearchaeota archaeon]